MPTHLLLARSGGGSFIAPHMPDQGQALPGTFTKQGIVFALGSPGSWDDDEIDGESVFYDNRLNKFVMVYDGYITGATYPGNAYHVGIAYCEVADFPMGPWTREAANPVINLGYDTFAPMIVQMPDLTYRMYLQKNFAPARSLIFMLTSSDLISWTVVGDAIGPAGGGTWFDATVFDPYAILRADGTTDCWFGGWTGSNRNIGSAHLDTDGVTVLSIAQSTTVPLFGPGPGEASTGAGAPAILQTSLTHYGAFMDSEAVSGIRWIDHLYTTDGTTFTQEQQVLTKTVGDWDSVQVFDGAPIWWNGTLYLFYAGSAIVGGAAGLQAQIGVATMSWPGA